ncbi:MAG: hypothetical protein EOM12_03690 [Verrucomicrobiae bacterium]|nr:hypothetical protein [Verrucomicrobiae bacterium]
MQNPFSIFKKRAPGEPSVAVAKQQNLVAIQKRVVELQNSLSILIGDATTSSSTIGNPYTNYKEAIAETAKKYEGTAQWGVQQVRNIIDVRSAFIIGQGFKLIESGAPQGAKKSREMEFVEEFVKHNDLDEETPQELAKEGEIEGRCLVNLFPNKDGKNIDFRFIPYSVYGYEVHTDPKDYEDFLSVSYQDLNTKAGVTLKKGDFVYRRFAGRLSKVNEIMPKVAMVLRHCEALDKALWDWRTINNIFAAPTPYFKCENATDVDPLLKKLKELNWKIGKVFAGVADFQMVGMNGAGLDSLYKEIECLAKIISGATGVPVHFLGFSDLMSNRSTSTDLFEFINASVNRERKTWEGFYQELFDAAILKHNSLMKTTLKTGVIKAEVLTLTEAQLRLLSEIWLPLYTAGVIDLDYFLGKIPDIDPAKVKESQDEAAQRMLESIRANEAAGSRFGDGAQPKGEAE